MPSKKRVYMVAEKIRELIAVQLQRMADPRLEMLTVTSVSVSPDLRHAKIYWVASGREDRRADVAEGLKSASGFFKKMLSKELGIRFVPDLHFFYDDTLDTQEEVNRLIDRIHDDPEDPEAQEDPDA